MGGILLQGHPSPGGGQHSGLLANDPLGRTHPEKLQALPARGLCRETRGGDRVGDAGHTRIGRWARRERPGICGPRVSNGNFSPLRKLNAFLALLLSGGCARRCGHARTHACTRTLTPSPVRSHTPTTPLPSRMFSSSPAPQLPLAEGSVLRHSGLRFLTCGAALQGGGRAVQPLYCQTRAAVCSVRERAVLLSLRQALRGSWDGQPGGRRGTRTWPMPRGSAEVQTPTAFLLGPDSWSLIGQLQAV